MLIIQLLTSSGRVRSGRVSILPVIGGSGRVEIWQARWGRVIENGPVDIFVAYIPMAFRILGVSNPNPNSELNPNS